MNWFVAIAALMTVIAALLVLWPVLRRSKSVPATGRSAANLALLREALADLDAEFARGDITAEKHAQARTEIERRVLEEVVAKPDIPAAAVKPARRGAAAAVIVLVLLAAPLLYTQIGNPGVIAPQHGSQDEAALAPGEVDEMLTRLAARLEANPDDPAGWALLARSYYAMERFPEAVTAFVRATKLTNDDAGLYADYADALAMTRDRRFDREVMALVARALELDPDHPKALLIAGSATFARNDYARAVTYLERLQQILPPDSRNLALVGERLAEARALAGGKGATPAAAPAATGPTVRGRVELSTSLRSKVAPTDTVFILARAPEGSRMPLAILKRQVKDLPVEFSLSDEQAMSPAMKLSAFPEVVVVARVSKSGTATPQSGDLLGTSATVKVGTAGLKVSIDSVVP